MKSTFSPNLLTLSLALFQLFASLSLGQQTNDSNSAKIDDLNEQTIYIPYDKLKETFERDGRGVFIPYEKFQQLWKEARANQPKPVEITPPLGAVIMDIESTATLGRDIVNVQAVLQIELLSKGWHRVPLRLGDCGISTAQIDGRPARVVATEENGFELLIENDAPQPKTIELNLTYAKGIAKDGAQSTVSFQAPQAPVNRWRIVTGQPDLDLTIEPIIATTRKPATSHGNDNDTEDVDNNEAVNPIEGEADDLDEDKINDQILAFVGAADTVKLSWTPRTEGATGMSSLVAAETFIRLHIEEKVVRTSATVQLDISRSEIDSILLSIPDDQKVVNVVDRNVKRWKVETIENLQQLEVELFEPALGKQTLQVELEQFLAEDDDSQITVPQIRALEVIRNSGIVVVQTIGEIKVEPVIQTGVAQVDPADLPDSLKGQDLDFAFRYPTLPFDLRLNIKKIQPAVTVEQFVEAVISPDKLTLDLTTIFQVQDAGVFQVVLDIPTDFEIRGIRSTRRQQRSSSIRVDGYYRDAENPRRVIVTLGNRGLGAFQLITTMERSLDSINLQQPSDQSAPLTIEIPHAAIDELEFSTGKVMIHVAPALQVGTRRTTGLRPISLTDAAGQFSGNVDTQQFKPLLAFGFSHSAASLVLDAKRRKPQISVQQLMAVNVQSGVVNYDLQLFYDILYSGVRSLRLDIPTELVADFRNRNTRLVTQALDPQPDDLREGYTALELTADTEFLGKHEFRFNWENRIEALTLGDSRQFAVNRVFPGEVDRATGQVVLVKSESIDVGPTGEIKGLRPIDPQTDLRQPIANAALAFEFVDDWELDIQATRFELQELKRTSISRGLARAVVLRRGELSVQCLYQIRSVKQRLALQMPAGFDPNSSFDDAPIRVNGQRVVPERGGEDLIYVPLVGQNLDEPVLLEVRYTLIGDPNQISIPVFADDPAVQKMYLAVYLPHEKALIHQSGHWSDERSFNVQGSNSNWFDDGIIGLLENPFFRPRNESVDRLVHWVAEGLKVDTSASKRFEVDGRPYIFSTLQPDAESVLQLKTMNMNLLNGLVCGIIVLIGLIFTRAGWVRQLAIALVALATLVFVASCYPLIAEHLFGWAVQGVGLVVAGVWFLAGVFGWIRALKSERPLRETENPRSSPPTDPISQQEAPVTEETVIDNSARGTNDPSDTDKEGGQA